MNVNATPIEIDISLEEILDDLLYPERSTVLVRPERPQGSSDR